MSEIKLNSAQQEFVNFVDGNVLVSASAGSGKTTTMITKIMNLILEHKVPLKNMLIVTYTNSAASELKVKLYNKIASKISECEDNETVDFLTQQLESLNLCEIGTLHSVCKKIIKKYFYAIEQDSNFTLLSEGESKYYFGQAINNVFKNLISSNDENFYMLYSSFNSKRNTATLFSVVEKIYNFLCSKQEKQNWINYVTDEVYNLNLDENKCVKYLLKKFKSIFAEIKKELQTLYNESLNLDEKFKKFIECRLNFCAQVGYCNNYKEFESLLNVSFEKQPRATKSTTAEELEFIDKCEFIKEDFKTNFKKAEEFCSLVNMDELKHVKHIISNLMDVVKLVKEEYERIKEEKFSLDFNDLEEKTLQILQNDRICEEIKKNYNYIFVDEYQDINEMQESILQKLTNGNNLNLIGDVKQSIYEFRLSNPKLFLDKYGKYSKNINGKLINLNENYRSENNILGFVNFIFNEIITEKTLGINYKKYSQLVKGGEQSVNKVVTLDIINRNTKDESEESESTLQGVDEVESNLIVQKVVDLIGKKYVSEGVEKQIEYKDIAILLRSKKELAKLVYKKLKQINVPCNANFREDIFKTSEIMQLYSILLVLNNYHNDLACATVLKSKIFGLTDQELLYIRMINEKCSYYECINQYLIEGDLQEIKDKLTEFKNFLNVYNFYLLNHSVLETLQKIMQDYGLFEYYLSLPDGLEKETNIKEFFALLNNADYNYDLVKCLEYLEKTSQNGEAVLENETFNTNAVKIMTIHSSKGLEFPAVIVGGMGKDFLINSFTNNLIINNEYGVGVKYLNTTTRYEHETLVRLACRYENEKSRIDEEMRLLYVALTRAKNFLCCTGVYNLNKAFINKNKNVYAARNYLDFVFKGFSRLDMAHLENNESFVINKNKDCECAVFVHNKGEFPSFEEVNSQIYFNEGNKEIISKLQKYYAFEYPYKNKQNIAIKNSVSSILKEENDYENVVYAPKKLSLYESAENKDSLLLGTMYHSVMEKLSYNETDEEIINIINSVKQNTEFETVKNLLKENEILNCVKVIKRLIGNGEILKEAMFTMQDKHSNIVSDGQDENVIIQGVIDLIIKKENEVYLVDFKTNKFFKDEELINTYSTQLSLYANAYEKAFLTKVNKLYLYSFTKNKLIEIPKNIFV